MADTEKYDYDNIMTGIIVSSVCAASEEVDRLLKSADSWTVIPLPLSTTPVNKTMHNTAPTEVALR